MEKVYLREIEELERAQAFIAQENIENHIFRNEYVKLVESFDDAVGQMRLITKVSDKVQKKLDRVNSALDVKNAELDTKNAELDVKNAELQTTIDELTQARAGKIAATIVLIIAVMLFLLEELFIDNLIKNLLGTTSQWASVITKLVVVLMLKPLEGLLENFIISYLYKKKKEREKEAEKPKINTVGEL